MKFHARTLSYILLDDCCPLWKTLLYCSPSTQSHCWLKRSLDQQGLSCHVQALYFRAGMVLITLFNLWVHFIERGKSRSSKGKVSSQSHSAPTIINYLWNIANVYWALGARWCSKGSLQNSQQKTDCHMEFTFPWGRAGKQRNVPMYTMTHNW